MHTAENVEPAEELQTVRASLLRDTYRVIAIFGAVLMLANVARYVDTGWKPLYGIYFLAYSGVLATYASLARLPMAVSSGLLLAIFVGAPAAGLWSWGIAGNTAPVFLGACLVATVLTGVRGGLITLGICVAIFAAVSVLMHGGWHSYPFDVAQHANSATAWGAAIITFAAVAGLVSTQLADLRDWLADRILVARRARRAIAAQVDERREAERALRLSRARFRLAFDATPDAMMLCDLESDRIVEINPAFERLTGHAREHALERTAAALALWLDASLPHTLRSAIASGDAPHDLPGTLRAADGTIRDVRVSASRLELEAGPVLLLVARDESAQVRMAAQLRDLHQDLEQRVERRTRQLEAARRDLEGFIQSVSHDLRAPLRAIEVCESELLDSLGPEQASGAGPRLVQVRHAAQETTRLIDALLELSRINRRELTPETLDLSALAAEAIAQLRAGEPGRAVDMRIEPGVHAQADAALMRLVLANLLGNAWKFSARSTPARIEFGCRREPAGDAYFVRDNGVGFDMAYGAKLFEPFERLHAPSEFEGTGIGLATVARAVQRHGGRVWAESSPGQGATFWFRLA